MTCFSLRGTINLDDNARMQPVRLFDYVSPDRTRAWRVTRAYLWPVTQRAGIGSTEGKIVLQAMLATDDGGNADWNQIMNPEDNRSFAWCSWNGFLRDATVSDFISAETTDIQEFVIDPDPLIVKELWISAACTTESGTSPNRDWAYMIVLEEEKVSPSQSVFQQIKGMGQDI